MQRVIGRNFCRPSEVEPPRRLKVGPQRQSVGKV
jgi:hypothetical protein